VGDKKSKLPPGSRVERLPTRIFEEAPEEQDPKQAKRDVLFAIRDAERAEPQVNTGRAPPMYMQPDGTTNVEPFYPHPAEQNPMQEINAKAFRALHEKRKKPKPATEPVVRDRNGMLTPVSNEMRKRPTGWQTITRADGRRVRVPHFNPQGSVGAQEFIDTFEEEQPRFLDSVLSYLRD
jgi:hypothetical protein